MELGFSIPAPGGLDLLSLGALVHRIDPGVIPFRKATSFAVHVSGGEFNVAANLADCFGLSTGIASAMVNYPIGDLIAERVRAMGVKPFYKRFDHDGTRGPNMATVYSDQGFGVRAPVVFYNRCNEAAAQLKPGDFDWDAIFASGVRWFHSGGIFASLSETTADLVIEAMQAARRAGVLTSFDLNYREKLWKTQGGPDRARSVLGAIAENVDVLVGNEEDMQKGLGFHGPEVHSASKLDPAVFLGMMEQVISRYPKMKVVPPPSAKSTPPTATVGAPSPGSTATPSRPPPASSRSWTASAAAMALPPASSTRSSPANLPSRPSAWAGPTAPS